ncbi:hypothetical protein JCM10908_005783 [Rhodotorula pacifica]|uniref:uncharacterized protein n=1 Tax=Rhodotorula pacifica TaxID=1495444 RepID=UPI003178E5EB
MSSPRSSDRSVHRAPSSASPGLGPIGKFHPALYRKPDGNVNSDSDTDYEYESEEPHEHRYSSSDGKHDDDDSDDDGLVIPLRHRHPHPQARNPRGLLSPRPTRPHLHGGLVPRITLSHPTSIGHSAPPSPVAASSGMPGRSHHRHDSGDSFDDRSLSDSESDEPVNRVAEGAALRPRQHLHPRYQSHRAAALATSDTDSGSESSGRHLELDVSRHLKKYQTRAHRAQPPSRFPRTSRSCSMHDFPSECCAALLRAADTLLSPLLSSTSNYHKLFPQRLSMSTVDEILQNAICDYSGREALLAQARACYTPAQESAYEPAARAPGSSRPVIQAYADAVSRGAHHYYMPTWDPLRQFSYSIHEAMTAGAQATQAQQQRNRRAEQRWARSYYAALGRAQTAHNELIRMEQEEAEQQAWAQSQRRGRGR